jgi:hypothetical protein
VTLAFLFPVNDTFVEFKKRVTKLFPETSINYDDIFDCIKLYNPFYLNQNVLQANNQLNELVTETLRTNVVEYMKNKQKKFGRLIKKERGLKNDKDVVNYLTDMVRTEHVLQLQNV